MCEGTNTSVVSICERTKDFRLRPGVRQGSGFKPLFVFCTVMDKVGIENTGWADTVVDVCGRYSPGTRYARESEQ